MRSRILFVAAAALVATGAAITGLVGRAFHEEDDVIALHFAVDVVVDAAHGISFHACGSQARSIAIK